LNNTSESNSSSSNSEIPTIGIALTEVKDSAHSPQGQAFSEGVNLVISQLQHGLMWDECCVALLLSNGQLYQFGFVTLLYPSFPVLHISSNVIDRADPGQLDNLVKHLAIFCN
jgi:hypothetical protein